MRGFKTRREWTVAFGVTLVQKGSERGDGGWFSLRRGRHILSERKQEIFCVNCLHLFLNEFGIVVWSLVDVLLFICSLSFAHVFEHSLFVFFVFFVFYMFWEALVIAKRCFYYGAAAIFDA